MATRKKSKNSANTKLAANEKKVEKELNSVGLNYRKVAGIIIALIGIILVLLNVTGLIFVIAGIVLVYFGLRIFGFDLKM